MPEAAELLSSELARVGAELSSCYDEERARHRALLEHRYELRKNLAKQKVNQVSVD